MRSAANFRKRPGAARWTRLLGLLAICVCAWSFAGAQGQAPADVATLRRQFENPPDDARIMMRWWWFGPAVTHAELERELNTMKAGGIGGVEVQPVYPLALDDAGSGFKNLPYLSDDFLDALRFTSHKTHELGLRMDLTVGSGWPYGGPSVPVDEAAGMLRIVRVSVKAGTREVSVPDMGNGESLIAAFLAPADRTSQHALEEFHALDAARGQVAVPSDAQDVLFFVASHSGQQVKRPAVGAEGFVVSHYDATATDHYLHAVGDRLMQAFDQERPYAVFCDSLEVYNSDWTGDFLEQFAKRRGYDLRPYLPALAADIGAKTADIHYDWARTLSELFEERFATRLHEWARRNGTRLRMQSYGTPPAELSSNALVDLPEGEGAQWNMLSATRWASSASHIYGVPVTSSETWTWLHSPVFRATPLDMKAEADRHFLEGINQLVGHGWPYTPPGVAYPGWRFYAAAVFDEKNPWWSVMPDITRYLQRMSFLLRQGRPANDVAVYLPTSDAMAKLRPGHVELYPTLRDGIGPNLVTSVTEAGFGLDFFDDAALRNVGRIDGNALALGANRYRVIILPDVERMPVDSYRQIEAFVKAGGVLVATRRLPDLAPGVRATETETGEVRRLSQRLFEGQSAPARLVKDDTQLAAALKSLLTPDVAFSSPTAEIGFVHRRTDEADVYFVANTSNQLLKEIVTFRVNGRRPEWWNPFTGRTSPAHIYKEGAGVSVEMDLAPYESRVLVFSAAGATPAVARQKPTAKAMVSAGSEPMDLSSGWHVTFGSTGVSEVMQQLRSWTDDERTRYFSGSATYEKTFQLPAASIGRGRALVLDLGSGKALEPRRLNAGMQAWLDAPVREAAVVYVNGERAGSVWCAPYELAVTPWLHAGENRLRIEVSNLAINEMAGRPLPDYRLLNLRYGVRFEAQDMDKVQPATAGLLGSIRLITRTQ